MPTATATSAAGEAFTDVPASTPATPATERPPRRAVLTPLAPERYRLQFTVGEATHEKLRRVQDLLRREIPDGDPGAIAAKQP